MIVPVIAIDGPSGSGKGTVAQRVAARLGFHYLDSGALYRLVALAAQHRDVSWDDAAGLADIAQTLPAQFLGEDILLDGEEVSADIRTEACSQGASKVAVIPEVRAALLARQRDYRIAPGLVADGRDMASVVFPDAKTKVFLTASLEARASRRYNQLIDKGLDANMADVLQELAARDARDTGRSVAPLRKMDDAWLLDTTSLSIVQAVDNVIDLFRQSTQGASPAARST